MNRDWIARGALALFITLVILKGWAMQTRIEQLENPRKIVIPSADINVTDNTVTDTNCSGFACNHYPNKEKSLTLYNSEWVEVVNPEPIKNANITLKAGDTCRALPGGKLTAIGEREDAVLIRYDTDQDVGGGTPCPSGTLFFRPKWLWQYLPRVQKEAQEAVQKQKRLADAVKEMLGE